VEPGEKLLAASGLTASSVASATFYEGAGCSMCHGTGYRGRTVIAELLDMSDTTRELILDRRPISEIKRHATEQGMSLLRASAVKKAVSGQTTLQEINKVTFVE
jgi:type II secretory ATPase GspE/PulE/Tfp pilus assembly ATPase PilB-like protein